MCKHFLELEISTIQPLNSAGTIAAKRISIDEEPSLIFELQGLPKPIVNVYPGCFVAFRYDNLWYFGMVSAVNENAGDAYIKFLHPNGPSPSFFWPIREDSCAIPFPHILGVTQPPQTITGRTYIFPNDYMVSVEEKMKSELARLRKRN